MRSLSQIKEEALKCDRCPLAATRRRVVFGDGPEDARYVFVAEHPGDQENMHGRPLSGSAGQFFNGVLLPLVGVSRADVFVTHNVMCTPPANRLPTKAEVDACRPWLTEILYTVDPVLVFALGTGAVEALTSAKVSVVYQYGRLLLSTIQGHHAPYHLPLVVLSSPSFIQRLNESTGKDQKEIPPNSHIHQWCWAVQHHLMRGDRLVREWFGDIPPRRGMTLFDPPQRLSLVPRMDPDYTVAEMNEAFHPVADDLAEGVDGDPYAEEPQEGFVDQSGLEDEAEDADVDFEEGPVE